MEGRLLVGMWVGIECIKWIGLLIYIICTAVQQAAGLASLSFAGHDHQGKDELKEYLCE